MGRPRSNFHRVRIRGGVRDIDVRRRSRRRRVIDMSALFTCHEVSLGISLRILMSEEIEELSS
jgi:hypothetical protein